MVLSGEKAALADAQDAIRQAGVQLKVLREDSKMTDLIQTYLPNVYKMGWSGQAGWGTAIYLTLYMTVLSFIIGGFLGLVAGLFLVLTAPGGVLENKVIFWILDKITSIFRAVPFIILLAIMSPLSHLIVKTSIGPNAALSPPFFCGLCLLCPSGAGGLG